MDRASAIEAVNSRSIPGPVKPKTIKIGIHSIDVVGSFLRHCPHRSAKFLFAHRTAPQNILKHCTAPALHHISTKYQKYGNKKYIALLCTLSSPFPKCSMDMGQSRLATKVPLKINFLNELPTSLLHYFDDLLIAYQF